MIKFHVSKPASFKCLSVLSPGENALKELIRDAKSPPGNGKRKNVDEINGKRKNVDEIKNIVTAKNLCSCRDPIMMAFEVITITIRSLSNDDA